MTAGAGGCDVEQATGKRPQGDSAAFPGTGFLFVRLLFLLHGFVRHDAEDGLLGGAFHTLIMLQTFSDIA